MRYIRVPHRISATVLDEPWSWTTENGDHLEAQAGDYLVTDPSTGKQWSVTVKALRSGYKNIGRGLFQSRGEVNAYRVPELHTNVSVISTEGPEMARPGDWVVTDLEGNAWVVDHAWFRDRYQPVQGT